MSTDLVIFLHRLGVKVYRVSPSLEVSEEVDISSTNIDEMVAGLTQYSSSTIRLLVSDTVCYLFHTTVSGSMSQVNRASVLAKIKGEVPEDIESTRWDYKVVNSTTDMTEVIVFATTSEYQLWIDTLTNKLDVTIEAIEPESIAVTRHPNPIVGLYQKKDYKGQDSQSLNISVAPTASATRAKPPRRSSLISIILFLIGFVLINYFLYQKYQQSRRTTATPPPTPSPILPVSAPTTTPTTMVKKDWTSLKLAVLNGSGKAGLAGSVATKFKTSGVVDVTSGNAPNDNYSQSQLTFASVELQNQFQSQFLTIFPVTTANIKVDKSQSYDAILILGIN